MVARLGPRQRQHRGRKEHGLVVRVRNQQAHALLQQLGEAVAHGAGGDHVDGGHGGDERRRQHQQRPGVEVQPERQVEGEAEGVGHGGGGDRVDVDVDEAAGRREPRVVLRAEGLLLVAEAEVNVEV